MRYRNAVYRYLLGAVRNEATAEELAQDFAVHFLQGDFRRFDPERGRFRHYVKSVLIRMVNRHWKDLRLAPRQLTADQTDQIPAPDAAEDENDSFEACLRDDLMDQTWSALERANPNYSAALVLRVEDPDLSSREMAEQLSAKLATKITPDWVRKTIQRARAKFAQLLVEQAAAMLDCSNPEQLRAELTALNLLCYCRSAIEGRA